MGDSRAVMSGEGGAKVYHLSDDHKPSEEKEQKREPDVQVACLVSLNGG